MVEKPLRFSIPYFYGNATVFNNPIYAMYTTPDKDLLVVIAKKRYKADQMAPWYIGDRKSVV